MDWRRILFATTTALVGAGLLAPAAPASFHLISIREVYPGSTASPDSGYVELQMYSSGQQFVGGHAVIVYNAGGTAVGTFTFPSTLSNGDNQRTILVGDSGVQSAFGVLPDLIDSGFALAVAGGAACWNGTPDCVSWGAFTGSTPSASGSPADPTGIPDGMALGRTIEPNCPTLLEAADDTNDSAADFFDAAPNPRNNSSAVAETPCTGPAAAIDTKPANPTNSTTASFTYHATPASDSFECKLDGASFATCPAIGIEYAGPLAEGMHTFRVRAKDLSENVGTPAIYSWRVDTTAPLATIDTHPADPSPGAGASFTYHSSEVGSNFECSLAAGAAADSFSGCLQSGKSYTSLADGTYTFKIRATDTAGNPGAAVAFEWEVDNSLSDMTPPQTTILSKPPDPSDSSTASFTYESDELGSSFQCSLDEAAFAGCPVAGKTYIGLANGAHTFLVRAIDASENVDLTPAGYSFAVEVPAPLPPVSIAPEPMPAVPVPPTPETRITAKPRGRTRDRTPTVRFRSNVGGAGFQCSVDRQRFRTCRSPFTAKRLRPGRHRIRVRAISGGAVDPTPAASVFRVVGGRRLRRASSRKRHHRARADRRRGHGRHRA